MQKIIYYDWKNSKIPKVPSSAGVESTLIWSLDNPKLPQTELKVLSNRKQWSRILLSLPSWASFIFSHIFFCHQSKVMIRLWNNLKCLNDLTSNALSSAFRGASFGQVSGKKFVFIYRILLTNQRQDTHETWGV